MKNCPCLKRLLPAAGVCILIPLFLMCFGCAPKPALPVYKLDLPERPVDYQEEVEPILVKRCVVCHSCYNSPCQLKLSSWDGFDRGASKEKIYNASRLRSMDPSRLLVDGHSTEEWRAKGFVSVKPESGEQSYDQSIIYRLLDHKRFVPQPQGSYYSDTEDADLTCAKNNEELDSFLKKHPNRGMPYGFPPLKQSEFNLIAGWLAQGAPGPSPEQVKTLKAIPLDDRRMVDRWEALLNNPDPKYRLTARYLYEHLFLAHITFETGSDAYYELVRSHSPSTEPIDIIATVRPYDDPGGPFYYRFRKIYSTIVHKTHMVFPFGEDAFNRVNELFISPQWKNDPQPVDYDRQRSANPFITFEQIPAQARYQWLLDNARYVIMTFIRGPVCKGQVALNVINDHFWLLFLKPEYDLAVKYPGFLKLHQDNLRMPIEKGSDSRILRVLLENSHYKKAIDYYYARQQFYGAHYPDGLSLDAIWKGDQPDDQPVLTVFRHFDSASVHRGVLGNLPKTIWVMDYPLLERIYYALVAGFDVYGNNGHQLSVRLYMDALRIEGESYFLDFMPQESREEMMHTSWYTGVVPDKVHYFPAPIPAAHHFFTTNPKRELIEELLPSLVAEDISFDQNYLAEGAQYPSLPGQYQTIDDFIKGFVAVSAPGISFFRHVGDHNANLAWVRIKNIPGQDDKVVSAIVDRWHDNVKFITGEEKRFDPERDRADFVEGFIGSYPNYFFVVDAFDLPDFFSILDNYDGTDEMIERLEKYGINRAEEGFWEVYDWFQQRFDQQTTDYPGLIDLNRYFHLALEQQGN